MRLQDLATEYIALGVVNIYTADKVAYVAKLFDERSGIQHIDEMSLSALAQYKTETLKKVRPVTYNGYLGYLRILGKYGVEQGYFSKNWFKTLKMAPKERRQLKVISEEGLLTAINFCKQNPDRFDPMWFWVVVIRFLYFTGVRRRQLVHLRVGDVSLHRRKILLRTEGSKTHREWEIPIAEPLIYDIDLVMAKSAEVLGRNLTKDDPLFNVCWFNSRYLPNKVYSDLMKPEQITQFFRRLSKGSGVRIGTHRFRHTLATKLCNPKPGDKPDLFAVQSLLGHSSLNTTREYVQTDFGSMADLVNSLDCPIQEFK